jgi:transketolase
MRNAFADELTKLAADDPRVVMLSGDIGNRLFDTYKDQHPDRFFNCGVAEANMISMGAGMAMCGLRPVAYTITPFITTRCLEQIRVDVCYHHQSVIIVGVGAGMSYASLGATHHACEDIAFLRALPGMTVICPGDAMEVRAALRAALKHDGPVYIRLGKKNEPVIHPDVPDLKIGEAIILREGADVCLLSTGNLLPNVCEAADLLAEAGISAQVVSFHTVKPLDERLLRDAFARFPLVTTVEEHSVIGGLGGAVAEWRADQDVTGARLLRIGTPDNFMHEAGSQSHARELFGLTPDAIVQKIRAAVAETMKA